MDAAALKGGSASETELELAAAAGGGGKGALGEQGAQPELQQVLVEVMPSKDP